MGVSLLLDELETFVEGLTALHQRVIITGDLNIHVNKLVSTLGMKQIVTCTPQESDSTLDLILLKRIILQYCLSQRIGIANQTTALCAVPLHEKNLAETSRKFNIGTLKTSMMNR